MESNPEQIDIKDLIPHREPFLLVDCLGQYDKGERLQAVKAVSRGDPWFLGHFPDFPIMPGVLVTEALAQTCAAFMSLENLGKSRQDDSSSEQMYVLLRSDVRFPKPVLPGRLLELDVKISERTSAFDIFKVKASQNGQACARGSLTVAATSKINS